MSISRRQFVTTTAALAVAASMRNTAYASGAGEPDVIVIGAGLSGLATAMELEANGLKVLLLEGRQRIGGRIYTLFDVPGHPEVGFNSLANAYGRTIDMAARVGVEIVNLAPKLLANRAGQELFLDGKHIPLKDWATHPRNPFPADMKQLPPWGWADAMFKRHMPFKDLENWYDPQHAQHDISVHQFLTSHGASEAMIRLGYDTNIAYGTTSHDVSLLMQAFTDHWQAVNRGAIMGFSRTGAANAQGVATPAAPPAASMDGVLIGMIQDGNERLTQAMAQRLKGDLLQGKRVVAIDTSATGGTVRCADGSSYRAKAVVCTMPFSTLRHVAIDPLPPAQQLGAITKLGYIPITQFHLVAKQPFWEQDGLSPSMWTDGPLGLVLAQRFFGKENEVTSLTVWCRGNNGLFIDRFGIEGGKQLILDEFARLRPASKGKLSVAAVHSWTADPFSAGDWAIYEPGQVSAFQNVVAQPHERLYFAGEHTAVGSRGVEAALESAERATLEVLGALG
jgi:monoamine oxidase